MSQLLGRLVTSWSYHSQGECRLSVDAADVWRRQTHLSNVTWPERQQKLWLLWLNHFCVPECMCVCACLLLAWTPLWVLSYYANQSCTDTHSQCFCPVGGCCFHPTVWQIIKSFSMNVPNHMRILILVILIFNLATQPGHNFYLYTKVWKSPG